MKAASETIPGACGVANLFNYSSYYEPEISCLTPQGGAVMYDRDSDHHFKIIIDK